MTLHEMTSKMNLLIKFAPTAGKARRWGLDVRHLREHNAFFLRRHNAVRAGGRQRPPLPVAAEALLDRRGRTATIEGQISIPRK